MRKSEMIAAIKTGHDKWLGLLAEVGKERMTTPGVAGEWSVKDIVAHIAWYEWWLGEWIRTHNWPAIPEHLNSVDTDTRNNAYFAEKRHTPLEQVLAEEDQYHNGLVAAVERLSDAEFADQTLLGLPAGKGWDFQDLIPESTFRHYAEHGETVRAWLAILS